MYKINRFLVWLCEKIVKKIFFPLDSFMIINLFRRNLKSNLLSYKPSNYNRIVVRSIVNMSEEIKKPVIEGTTPAAADAPKKEKLQKN